MRQRLLIAVVLLISLLLFAAVTMIDLTTQVKGQLPVANGGTGQTTAASALAALLGVTGSGTYLVTCSSSTSCTYSAAPAFVSIANTTTSTGTTAISANTCTSATTVTLTGATTSMVAVFAPTSDTSGVTGWGSSGGLVITAYVSAANTVSYKVCNQTSASITPGASVTWNVGVR